MKAFIGAKTFCWRSAYGRGVGELPRKCEGDEDSIGLFCYRKCSTYDESTDRGKSISFRRRGFDCHQNCPDDFTSTPLNCKKPVGKTKVDCQQYGLVEVPKIQGVCKKKIHEGKAIWGRCKEDQEQHLGLCYPICRADYAGVGPVCWRLPPVVDHVQWVECGMGAAKTMTDCMHAIAGQVMSPLMIALNVLSFGVAGIAIKALQTGIHSAQSAVRASMITVKLSQALFHISEDIKKKRRKAHSEIVAYGKAVIDYASKEQIKKSFASAHEACMEHLAANETTQEACNTILRARAQIEENLSEVDDIHTTAIAPIEKARAIINAFGLVDPTGIANTVAAYMYPKCEVFTKQNSGRDVVAPTEAPTVYIRSAVPKKSRECCGLGGGIDSRSF